MITRELTLKRRVIMSKFIKTITAASLICGLTFVANAESNSEIVVNEDGVRTIAVAYDDLNLSSAAGQQTLSTRVRAAVRKVCGHTTARQTLEEMQDYRACTTKASQNVLASLDTETRSRLAFKF